MAVGNPVAFFEISGSTVVPPHDLPGDAGRTAILTDPDGNKVGLWE